MLQVCRVCLLFITTEDEYFEIENASVDLSPTTNRYKITSIFPEMNLNVSKSTVICKSCYDLLDMAFKFKLKCMTTEGIIMKYMQMKCINEDRIDLKHVALVNNGLVVGAKISLENIDLIEVCSDLLDDSHVVKIEDDMDVVKQECIEISDDELDCQIISNKTIGLQENVKEFKEESPDLVMFENMKDSTNYYPKIVELPNDGDAGCSQNTQSAWLDYQYKGHSSSQCEDTNQFHDPTSAQYTLPQNDCMERNQCSMCLRTFQSQSRVRKHMSYHCKNRFNYVENNADGEVKLYDDSNDDDFEVNVTTSGYLVHKKPKAGVKKRFPCKLCSKKFRTSTGLSFHFNRYCKKKTKPNKRIYLKTHKCIECKKKIVSMITNDNPYRCNICVQQIFHNYNAYKWHMKYVHDANPYDCKLCTKTFTSKKDLWNHSCPGNKGNECMGCKEKNALFLTQYYGYRYKCKLCEERVSNYDSYKWHMEFMHKLDCFCGICFLTTEQFDVHICSFECAVCANVFKNKDDLENHPHMYMQE